MRLSETVQNGDGTTIVIASDCWREINHATKPTAVSSTRSKLSVLGAALTICVLWFSIMSVVRHEVLRIWQVLGTAKSASCENSRSVLSCAQTVIKSNIVEDSDVAKVSNKCVQMVKNFEGLRLQTYADVGGVLTIGYGHTGAEAKPGRALTEAQASALLCRDLERFEKAVENMLARPATPGQFDAMVSLAYNIGVGPKGFAGSTLLKKFNAGDIEGAAAEFAEWNVAGGVIQRGLVRRRAKEMIRFLAP